jgi:hypothetical protein
MHLKQGEFSQRYPLLLTWVKKTDLDYQYVMRENAKIQYYVLQGSEN